MMAQVQFTDPRTNTIYRWATNPPYDGPQNSQKQRQIQRTSNTGNVGVTKQQGDDGPFIIDWKVTVFYKSHQQAMWHWYELCKTQTIYLTDWEGNSYEGQIIMLEEQWVGAISGPGDTTARVGYAHMEMQFEIWRFISGYMQAAGVQP